MRMPTALIPLAASPAHAGLDLKASTVQVESIYVVADMLNIINKSIVM